MGPPVGLKAPAGHRPRRLGRKNRVAQSGFKRHFLHPREPQAPQLKTPRFSVLGVKSYACLEAAVAASGHPPAIFLSGILWSTNDHTARQLPSHRIPPDRCIGRFDRPCRLRPQGTRPGFDRRLVARRAIAGAVTWSRNWRTRFVNHGAAERNRRRGCQRHLKLGGWFPVRSSRFFGLAIFREWNHHSQRRSIYPSWRLQR